MSRSTRKGPWVDQKLLKKVGKLSVGDRTVIKTWSRSSEIAPEMVGFVFGIHNGKFFIEVTITEDMVGHRLGEFSPTKKFIKHGGKMQKELEKGATAAPAAPAAGGKAPAAPAAKK